MRCRSRLILFLCLVSPLSLLGVDVDAAPRESVIDCAQCRAVCAAGPGKSYSDDPGTANPTAAVKHSSPQAEAAFVDAKRKDPAFGGKDNAGAVQGYKRAVLIDANNSQYRNHLAAALLAAGAIDEAIYNLEQAAKLVPSEPKYLVNLGYAHHRNGDETRALLYYLRGLLLDPRDVRARLFAGYALEILGYRQEAALELKKVLLQDPQNDSAKRALARLGLRPAGAVLPADPAGVAPPIPTR